MDPLLVLKISRWLLPLALGFLGYLLFAQFASARPVVTHEVITDVSGAFKSAWHSNGQPLPAMPADDPETALAKMKLRWLAITPCKHPNCETR